jgi:hypothetical protein
VVFQRLDRQHVKRTVSRLFSDGMFGGKRKALAAAIKWRDRVARKLPPPAKPWKATSPGYGYVYRSVVKRRAGVADVWIGWAKLGAGRGKHAQTSVSIERWGSREAKRRCERWLGAHRKKLRAHT